MKKPRVEFEHIGWAVDYMSNGKFIASVNIKEPDREKIGYAGRQFYIADRNIGFKNGKTIKRGQNYYTMLYPLCGKVIKNN